MTKKKETNYATIINSDEFLNVFNEHFSEYFVLTSPEGIILHMDNIPNGYSETDLLGKSTFDFMVEPYKTITKERFLEAIETDNILDNRFVSITGRYYSEKIIPFEYQKEKYIVQLSFDISEFIKTKELHRLAIDSSPIGIAISQNNTIIDCNDRFCAILERAKDEVAGKKTNDLIASNSVEKIKERSRKRLDGVDVPETYLIDVITGDGGIKTVKHSVTIAEYEGNPALFSYIEDITKELELKEERERLLNQFNFLLETSPFGIMIVNAVNEKIMYVNSRLAFLLDGRKEDYVGKPAGSIIHPDQRAEIMKLGRKRVRGEDVPDVYNVTLIKSDGQKVYAQNTVQLTEYDQQPSFINYFKDMSDIQKIQQEKADMMNIIQQTSRLEKIGTMASGLAHDFNNLLMGIDGTLSLIQYDMDKEDLSAHVKTIRRAAQEAKNIIKQMLDLSGKSNVVSKTIDLYSVLQDVEGLIKPLLSEYVELIFKNELEHLFFEGNETQVKQIVVNLVSNANEVLSEPHSRIWINTGEIKREDMMNNVNFILGNPEYENYVYFEVSNNGPKIPSEYLNKIFDPFFSSKDTGRGLGLSVVLGIVRSHNGIVEFNTSHENTTFRLLFPKSQIQSKEYNEAKESKNQQGKVTSLKVMIVDDNETVLHITRQMVEKLGHSVIPSNSRIDALTILENQNFDLVILDLSMPSMPFDEFFDKVQSLIDMNTKILLMSGYSNENLTEKLNDTNVEFIGKPFSLTELDEKIVNFIVNETS